MLDHIITKITDNLIIKLFSVCENTKNVKMAIVKFKFKKNFKIFQNISKFPSNFFLRFNSKLFFIVPSFFNCHLRTFSLKAKKSQQAWKEDISMDDFLLYKKRKPLYQYFYTFMTLSTTFFSNLISVFRASLVFYLSWV